ncbi:hypothetical protein AMECASPLE_011155 [Ameca splendens]|uniref:Uncharacterized protein n=1 Tax=Ameca splendens TaxID=208324 RepID=A0ABV0YBU2_9TELE
MLLQNLHVPFSINGAFTDVEVTYAIGTDTAPYHHTGWLLNLALITMQIVLFLFGLEDTTSLISKNNLKYYQTAAHFSTLRLSISNDLVHREASYVSGCCLSMALVEF